MFALQNIAKSTPRLVSAVNKQIVRNEYIIATKPRVRIPLWEKLTLGTLLVTIPFIVPIYVMLNIKKWNAPQEQ